MRILFLAIFILTITIVPLLAVLETEGNDIPPLADVVPVGEYTNDQIGIITPDTDSDWFTYHVNSGNLIQVTIVSASIPPALFVDVCTDNPAVVQFTLSLAMLSNSFVAQNGNMHYIRVYSTLDNNSYIVNLTNHTDPTLPVVLSSFTGICDNGIVGLNWVTQSETDLSGYNVLRNEDNSLASALQVNAGIISATNTSTTQQYAYEDQEVEANHSYYYWLESVNRDGTMDHYGPVTVSTNNPGGNDSPELANTTGMEPAYPNPFGNETNLKFRLASDMKVRLEIYNLKGEKIRTLYSGDLIKGIHSYKWDGKNNNGNSISSGLYLGRLTTPNGIFNSKLNLFK